MAGVLNLDERIEYVRQHVGRDPAAGVGDGDLEVRAVVGGGNSHVSLCRELDGIPDQIEENLAEAMVVQQNRRHALRLVDKLDSLPRRRHPEGREHFVRHFLQQHGLLLELHLPRVHLREVEDVVHELQKRRAAGADGLERLVPFARTLHSSLEKFGIAENRVERRADVVAHDAEERAPGLLGRTGAFKRILQLDGMLFSLFVLNDEHMEETDADETAERRKRRERPDDLKDNGRRQSDTAHEYHHASPAKCVTAANGLSENKRRNKNIVCNQKGEGKVTDAARLVIAAGIEIVEALVEWIDSQCRKVKGKKRIAEP